MNIWILIVSPFSGVFPVHLQVSGVLLVHPVFWCGSSGWFIRDIGLFGFFLDDLGNEYFFLRDLSTILPLSQMYIPLICSEEHEHIVQHSTVGYNISHCYKRMRHAGAETQKRRDSG
uniref:Uncharacterized protein n=1 Tax=Cacopsylla melanoneura TaxID=428564 RepID=A0A8D8YWP8_9HEMI